MIIRLDEEWSTYKKLLFLRALGGGGLSEYEITGNPVAFNTNVAKPLSAFTIPFLPVQSGTGDPSPSNVRPISGWSGVNAWRTGKNLFDPAKIKRPTLYNIRPYDDEPILLSAGTYTMSCSVECNGLYVQKGSTDIFTKYNSNYLTFTLSEATEVSFNFYSVTAFPSTVEVQLEVGSTASPFAEYTGASYPVTFPATGKNLLNPANNNSLYYGESNDYTLTDGVLVSIEGGSVLMGFKVKCKPNTKYTFTFTTTNNINMRVYGYPEEPETYTIGNELVNWNDHDEATFITSESDEWLICGVYIAREKPVTTVSNFQLEVGETATAYEPYTNTVYGGTLDAVNRVLTVEWAEIRKKWGLWSYAGTAQGTDVKSATFALPVQGYGVDGESREMYCNVAKKLYNTADGTTHFYVSGSNSVCWVYLPEGTDTDTEVQAIAKLKNPIEIPLSDIPVPVTLIGDNTIWTDTNGENTVKYLKKG